MINKKITTSLAVAILLVGSIVDIDLTAEEKFAIPLMGRAEAYVDLATGRSKWNVYGLVYQDAFEKRKQILIPFGVELVSAGCIVGTPRYKRDLAYNQTIYAHLETDARRALAAPIIDDRD